MMDRIRQITKLGQALWLDFISRDLLRSGRLGALIEEGLTGVTSNPTILQKVVAGGDEYDEQIRGLVRSGKSTSEIYEAIAFQDIADAADALRPVHNETHGRDGFVSIEVNPALAHDTERTIAEGRRIFQTITRPNVMIKVPATEAGIPAIAVLIGEGINVNVTLIFALSRYEKVMGAYAEGLRSLHASGRPLGLVSSVASFFVSRVDGVVDRQLRERIDAGEHELERLVGQAAIANAKVAYAAFKAFIESDAFADLRSWGARVQRPLWASTSAKDPKYSATKYIDGLIGPNTVNTIPPATLDAVREQGLAAQTIEQDVDRARATLDQLRSAGIDLDAVTDQLLTDGVQLFADSFDQLQADIEARRAALAQPSDAN